MVILLSSNLGELGEGRKQFQRAVIRSTAERLAFEILAAS